MSTQQRASLLKSQLRFTWEPLFSRFGSFTPVQLEAIPVVLRGEDCLIASRTASGKTEAATAPILERLKVEKWTGLSILYISPTRALVNDLFRRLEPSLAELAVTIGIRTGDSPNINVDAPPSVLITTPESFDVLLMRSPRMFVRVQALVLDEIHLLDNSARGDGLRLSIHRLRALRSNAQERGDSGSDNMQVIALSATIPKPSETASRYCVNARIIRVEGKRRINAELRQMASLADLRTLISEFRERGIRKALVFCGSRAESEELADGIKPRSEKTPALDPFGGNIFVHHGSLDRKLRLETEARFGEATIGICFATSTLELGVDIGDIDLVILAGPPFSVGSFLQRIGRGNRRTNLTSVICFYRSPRERHLFNVLLDCAEAGLQDESVYFFRPSVVVQQLLSYLKQNKTGALLPRHFRVLLDGKSECAPLLTAVEQSELIDHLIAIELLKPLGRYDALLPGSAASHLYERHQVNGNIEATARTLAVVDDLTGRVIGEVQQRDLMKTDTFALGGNRLDVVRQTAQGIMVDTSKARGPIRRLRYSSRGRVLPFDLAQRLGQAVGKQKDELFYFEYYERWYLLHALGNVYGTLLSMILKNERSWNSKSDGIFLIGKESPPSNLKPLIDEKQASQLVMNHYQKFEKMLGTGRFQSHLPISLRRVVAERATSIPRFCKAISNSKFIEITDRHKRDRLLELI